MVDLRPDPATDVVAKIDACISLPASREIMIILCWWQSKPEFPDGIKTYTVIPAGSLIREADMLRIASPMVGVDPTTGDSTPIFDRSIACVDVLDIDHFPVNDVEYRLAAIGGRG